MSQTLAIRSMVTATKGNVLISMDLSQAESWIVAFLAYEQKMKQALMYGDIHTETAANALFDCAIEDVTKPMRYIGKRYNHASSYRMGAVRAAEVINKDSDQPPYVVVTVAESRQFSAKWHGYYNLKNWWAEIEEKLWKNRTLVTSYGRVRRFLGHIDQEMFKEATAYEPQSTVADHFNGMIQYDGANVRGGLDAIMDDIVRPSNGEILCVNQSHDSLILDCPASIANEIADQAMSLLHRPLIVNGEELWIPVDGEIGERWGELDKYKTLNHYKEAA